MAPFKAMQVYYSNIYLIKWKSARLKKKPHKEEKESKSSG